MTNRLEILGDIPYTVGVATSGGPDSMAVLDFLVRGGRIVVAFHFNHGTEHSREAEEVVKEYCIANELSYVVGNISSSKPSNKSMEEHWRDERYKFLESKITFDIPIITCHTLDDQVENWIFTSLHGNPRLIPYRRGKIIRPFISTKKEVLVSWCDRKNVPYVIDPGNSDPKYMRSLIRTRIVPEAMKVNPGLHKVIRKKVKKLIDIS